MPFCRLRLPARNPFSPPTTCAVLPPQPAPPTPLTPLRAPSPPPSRPPPTLSPDPPRQPPSAAHDPPDELAPGSALQGSGSGRRLSGTPSSAPWANRVRSRRRKPSSSTPGTVRGAPPPRCTLGRLRRLPVTPQPQASDRHRLPQQPANCSTTTSPLIDWAHALNNSRSHWLRRGLGPPPAPPPRCAAERFRPGAREKTGLPYPSPPRRRLARSASGLAKRGTHTITHYQLPGSSLRSSLPCLGSFAPGPERLYDLLRFPAVRNSGRQRVRFRLAPAGRLNVECLERSDCCQVI